jgi:hypothetical protein
MDSSHVSLISLKLNAEGFDRYRCDRNVSLGLNLASLSKILKCAGNDDTITMKVPARAATTRAAHQQPLSSHTMRALTRRLPFAMLRARHAHTTRTPHAPPTEGHTPRTAPPRTAPTALL